MAMKINLSAVISFNQNVDPHSLYSIRLTVNIVTTSLCQGQLHYRSQWDKGHWLSTWTIFTQLNNINLINITVIQPGARCGGFSINAYIVSIKQMFVHTFTNQYWPMLGVGGYNRGQV